MFLAIIIPPAKRDKAVTAAVIAGFLFSYLFSILPFLKEISSGTRTIILTIAISAVISLIKPVKVEEEVAENE